MAVDKNDPKFQEFRGLVKELVLEVTAEEQKRLEDERKAKEDNEPKSLHDWIFGK